MTLAIHTRLGPYEVQRPLGAGGMGEVYRARDTRLERDVAIKVLPEPFAHDPQALARFYREVRAIAALSHPHILTIYDIGTEQGFAYAVMELLEGQTLGDRIKRGVLDWRPAVEIAAGIADGLAAAHAKGVVHRDVKPENLFLTEDGGVKILDFGLARLDAKPATPPPGVPTLETQPGLLLGTVAYMSPEQVRGEPADPRSDIFALGCVLYEMVKGRRPFLGQTAADTLAAILHDPAPALSQSGRSRPAELDRLILRCVEKDPARRFQSARELAAALRGLGQGALTGTAATRQQLETAPYLGTARPPLAPPQAPSVAVLPFRNMSSDAENEYFSDGLAEELINALTRIEGVHVASRTSAFAFKGKNEDVRKIGEQLNVRTVLEGSVRKAGNRLRISAQLVSVADGYQLWSETYNRELEDVFAIQDEIARNITKALRVILSEKEKRAIEKVPTADVNAYDCYLRGRQFFHQFRRKGFEFAQEMFARAIELDPGYALAHAGIADCHSLLYMYWDTSPTNLRRADEASRKALEFGPDLAEAHVARGLAVALKKDFAEAEQEFTTAIRLDPSLFAARYFYGRACLSQGKLLEAAHLFEQACQLRPDDYQAASHLGSIYAGLGRRAGRLQAVPGDRPQAPGTAPGRRPRPLPGRRRLVSAGGPGAGRGMGGPGVGDRPGGTGDALQRRLRLFPARAARKGPRLPGKRRPARVRPPGMDRARFGPRPPARPPPLPRDPSDLSSRRVEVVAAIGRTAGRRSVSIPAAVQPTPFAFCLFRVFVAKFSPHADASSDWSSGRENFTRLGGSTSTIFRRTCSGSRA
jgi:serine/threonine protein kinase